MKYLQHKNDISNKSAAGRVQAAWDASHKLALQRGAAILLAMLIVSVAAIFAARAQWQQWRLLEVESGERMRQQAGWILVGALDWARLILREDARANQGQNVDHLGEPWAIALQRSKMSDFLNPGLDNSGRDGTVQEGSDIYISGSIQDAQGRLNLQNLIEGQSVHRPTLAAFHKLFAHLELPAPELDAAVARFTAAYAASAAGAAPSNSAQPSSAAPLPSAAALPNAQGELPPFKPQCLEDWQMLGLSQGTLRKLEPHAIWLPERTPLNANTASMPALYASIPGLDVATAQRMLEARAQKPFQSLADVMAAAGIRTEGQAAPPPSDTPPPLPPVNSNSHGVSSRYFLVAGRLQLQALVVDEQSLVRRDDVNVRTVWRRSIRP